MLVSIVLRFHRVLSIVCLKSFLSDMIKINVDADIWSLWSLKELSALIVLGNWFLYD